MRLVEVAHVLRLLSGCLCLAKQRLVLAHQLFLTAHVRCMLVTLLILRLLAVIAGGRRESLRVDPGSIGATDLLLLHLLNYLLHVLTCVLQLLELLLEPDVEGLERDDFLGGRHRLDTCQQVVRHIVAHLKNAVLLKVNLPHALVLNLVD